MKPQNRFTQKYGKLFNIRVPPDKQPIVDEYKHLVQMDQHSDLCYVTVMLMESYVKAFRDVPEPTMIRLVHQNVTIQQNCTMIYGTTLKRARRLAKPEQLIPQALPKCEFCEGPATRRYFYPMHGYLDVCGQHFSNAKKALGFKDLTKEEKAKPIVPPPAFPLKKRKRRKRKRKVKPKRWSKVKQLLSKLRPGRSKSGKRTRRRLKK